MEKPDLSERRTQRVDIVTVVVDVGRHVDRALRKVDGNVLEVRVGYQLKLAHVQLLGVRIRRLPTHTQQQQCRRAKKRVRHGTTDKQTDKRTPGRCFMLAAIRVKDDKVADNSEYDKQATMDMVKRGQQQAFHCR